ncbi:hypothetical protein K438DRAFT_2028570 [Mycena galopus ATCC 62051]|nr:hypothetical protein K438DRAFT_2028570 [Mycena galopus ATCC 62051]
MSSASTHPNTVSPRLQGRQSLLPYFFNTASFRILVCLTVMTDINAKRKLLLLDWSQTFQPARSLSSVDLLIATWSCATSSATSSSIITARDAHQEQYHSTSIATLRGLQASLALRGL